MKLSFAEFKSKLVEARDRAIATFKRTAAPTTATGLKVSETLKKRWMRSRKTAARAACDSFRYLHSHQSHPSGRLHGWGGKKV